MAKISLVIADSHSLKEKRMVLRRIKDRVRERAGVVLNEVGDQDVWQRAELGCAVASGDRGKALEVIDEVVRVAMSAGGAQIVAIAKDVTTFSPDPRDFVSRETASRSRRASPAGRRDPLGENPEGFAAESAPFTPIDDRTGTGDKAQGSDDFVPDEWRDQVERE
jgi:uncharacterized protein YlxP (DUF503 family)